MSFNNKESELADVIRILNKKEGSEIETRLAKVVQKLLHDIGALERELEQLKRESKYSELEREMTELRRKVHRVEIRTQGMDK